MDLWHVELNISEQKFKGEGLHTIKIALPKNYYVFSFDLKAVYHYVDIFSNHHKYPAFSWNFGTGYVRHFQFTVLPFVLSSAPFIFTRLLKPLETQWRRQGILIAIFFDDGIGAGFPLILLRLTVPLFAQIFHTVASKFTKKSSIGSPRENFLGLAIILTLKRGSVSQAVDP